jgi:hypothetical protein
MAINQAVEGADSSPWYCFLIRKIRCGKTCFPMGLHWTPTFSLALNLALVSSRVGMYCEDKIRFRGGWIKCAMI